MSKFLFHCQSDDQLYGKFASREDAKDRIKELVKDYHNLQGEFTIMQLDSIYRVSGKHFFQRYPDFEDET